MAETPPGSAPAAPDDARDPPPDPDAGPDPSGSHPMDSDPTDSHPTDSDPTDSDPTDSDPTDRGPPAPTDSEGDFGALRSLLVGPEQSRLDALEDRLDVDDVRADEVARVLPEAVRRKAEDPQLARSLQPLIAQGFDHFIEAGQARVVEALTPVMGALIRQWVARELKTRLAELSRVLDQSLSPRSLAWRFEALTTRRPFAEVVLLRSLRWRVVRALLIHAETGILLSHVSAPRLGVAGGAVEQDPDVVSSMLTAVQSYLQDGFGAEAGDAVDAITIGDKTVWIANTPRAVLAVELEGAPDPAFRGVVDETMESIEQRAYRRLVEFEGDVDRFADVEPLLHALVERSPDPPSPRLWPALTALAVVLGLGLFTAWTSWQADARWQATLEALEATPGVVVIAGERDGPHHFARGLLDPLAASPDQIVARHGINPEHWHPDFQPYHAHHPPFVLARLQRALDPPPTVQLHFADGTAHISGEASAGWWDHAAGVSRAVAGVERVDRSGLRITDDRLERARLLLDPPPAVTLRLDGDTLRVGGEAPSRWFESAARRGPSIAGIAAVDTAEAVDELDASTARVEAVEIEFAPDVAELTAAGEAQLTRTLGDMARLRQARPWLRFVVEGHADATGTPKRNAELRAARADVVADRLLTDVRLQGAVMRRAAEAGRSKGRIARILVEVPRIP